MSKVLDLKDVKEQKDFLRFSRDAVHTYSPAAQKMINLALHYFDMAFEAGEKGRLVVWNNSACTQIIYACGGVPLSLADIGRYGDASTVQEAEQVFQIPAETCAMIKGIVGGLYQYRNTAAKKIITFGMRCEPEFTAIALMEKYGYQSYIMDIYKKPLENTEERLRQVEEAQRREMIGIARWLTDKDIDKERLHAELVRTNRVRDKVQKFREAQEGHINYFKTIPTFLAMSGAENYFGQPELFEQILDEMIAELEALPEGSFNEKRTEIVWSGARGVDFSVYNAVDMAGGYVSGWNLPTSVDERFDLSIDPLEAMVKNAMQEKKRASMESACAYDEYFVRECGAKGVVLYSTLGCTLNTVNIEMKRNYLNSRNIPTLVLTGTAQIGEVTGQLMTRLKAFVEMIG